MSNHAILSILLVMLPIVIKLLYGWDKTGKKFNIFLIILEVILFLFVIVTIGFNG